MADRISLVINDLKEELREVQEREAMLKTTISNLEKLMGANLTQSPEAPEAPAAPPPSTVKGPYSDMTIAQAAIKYLETVGRPQKTRIIADALKKGGSKSTNHYRAVYNGLLQHDKLAHLNKETSKWALLAWRKE
jgi:hypothetical protein